MRRALAPEVSFWRPAFSAASQTAPGVIEPKPLLNDLFQNRRCALRVVIIPQVFRRDRVRTHGQFGGGESGNAELSVAVPITDAPSLNLTLPVGVGPADVTAAVKVTAWPSADGLELRAVVVALLLHHLPY